ncbi:heterokaryon incompatibility protein-domain-containing protein [Podospora aff. communis PSN243]|uniref:Heterokaryon incompatibility protein-domain-containing protein n=1 Tax=Podospora aff. communis PSN243 TaxID=3040156 RepID=A0AAV9G2F2_9PEZI|nr:heterokaryon incompatibility protein-domain-containing protein [Podospora aff. communis PSN243]
MRLLKTRTEKLEFEEFWGVGTPLYAILSHTWGPGEITFQEVQKGNPDPSKPGFTKIIQTRTIAAAHGFEYVWIDTCCIDKSSSAELSEAINSMYEWYRKSTLCFAYLSDVISDNPEQTLAHSRWFTRGWTLQELIAPSIIVFLDHTWSEIGTKASLQRTLSYITGIPGKVLLDSDPSTASIAQRMSWASTRQTTRLEDQAYCLMGIFGINMPMLYGEGDRAFQRLQEEILKTSDDHTIFAWESPPSLSPSQPQPDEETSPSLLATSPHAFLSARDAIPLPSSHPLVGGITVDNKGIHLHVRLLGNWRNGIAVLPCRDKFETSGLHARKSFLGLQVRDLSGPSETGEFFRKVNNSLVRIGDGQVDANVHYIGRICIQRKGRFGAERQYSPLAKVAEAGDVGMLETLVEKGARLDRLPLAVAAARGNKPAVRWLLNRGVRADGRGVRPDRAALMWAGRNVDMVRVLFEGGAGKEDVAHLGLMALVDGDEDVLRLCLEFGYRPDKADLEMVRGDETGVLALLFETGLGIGPLGIKGV